MVLFLASLQEGKNVDSYGEELRKVLKFHKSHRKASVLDSLFNKVACLNVETL